MGGPNYCSRMKRSEILAPARYRIQRVRIQGGVIMYAIIKTGGKQYRVAEGDVITIEKLDAEGSVTFDQVLTVVKDGDVKVGAPLVDGAKVTGTVLEHGKAKKILVFKYKSKSNYRRRQGHRQPFTKVRIESIQA